VSFLSTIFLWALPLAAVPVLIHLYNRRRRQVVRWGAMHLLAEDATPRGRIRRIDELLLMLLRTLAVLAVVLALARPLLKAHWVGSTPGRDVILVVDTSMSMARMRDGTSVFEEMIERARSLTASLGEGDTIRVLAASTNPKWLAPVAIPVDATLKVELNRRLAELRPSLASADLLACVQEALAAESPESATMRFVLVLTDSQALSWRADATSNWRMVRQSVDNADVPTVVRVVEVGGVDREHDNIAVESIETARPLVGVGEPLTITAHVTNFGDVKTAPGMIHWTSGGEPLGASSVPSLDPEQSTGIPFEHVLPDGGVFGLAGTLNHQDELTLDNSGRLVVESVDSLPILIVTPESELDSTQGDASYVLAALGRGDAADDESEMRSVFNPTVVAVEDLEQVQLSDFHCVLLLNTPLPAEPALDQLADYVHAGGGVWWALGDRCDSQAFNLSVYREGEGLCSLQLDDPVGDNLEREEFTAIHPPSQQHPAVAMLGDTQRLDIDDVRIYRRFRFAPFGTSQRASILLEAGNGDPLAVENYVGRGRVIVQAFPLGQQWSNLPLCHVYVAMVHEWLWYLTGPSATSWNLQANEPALLKRANINEDDSVTITVPGGHPVQLVPTPDAEEERLVFRYAETDLPGAYVMTIDSSDGSTAEPFPFVVNREPKESDLRSLDETQEQSLQQIANVNFAPDVLTPPAKWAGQSQREPVWSHLLLGLLVFMTAELLLAGWLARRRLGSTETAPDPFVHNTTVVHKAVAKSA